MVEWGAKPGFLVRRSRRLTAIAFGALMGCGGPSTPVYPRQSEEPAQASLRAASTTRPAPSSVTTSDPTLALRPSPTTSPNPGSTPTLNPLPTPIARQLRWFAPTSEEPWREFVDHTMHLDGNLYWPFVNADESRWVHVVATGPLKGASVPHWVAPGGKGFLYYNGTGRGSQHITWDTAQESLREELTKATWSEERSVQLIDAYPPPYRVDHPGSPYYTSGQVIAINLLNPLPPDLSLDGLLELADGSVRWPRAFPTEDRTAFEIECGYRCDDVRFIYLDGHHTEANVYEEPVIFDPQLLAYP